MERGSDKHNPRLDEQLDHDTRSLRQGSPVEARAREDREQEGPAEGEPGPDARIAGGDRGWRGSALDMDEVEARSDLARHLQPSVFPGDRDALVASARERHAPAWVVEQLRRLPDGEFVNLEAVWEALGGRGEARA